MADYINEWNRKEVNPEVTVPFFQETFNKVGINTCFADYSTHKGLWHSVTLYDSDNIRVSTKGKGVSRAYSEASACGEFAERLQGEWLYRVPEITPNYISKKELDKETDKYLVEALGEKYIHRINTCQGSYFDMVSKKIIDIPDDLIVSYAGTNGLSAGNTKTEAFVQGTCEIFERYVTKMIYEKEYNEQDFPVLDSSLYENLHSYKMIHEIEKNGFKCYVKDCSLKGMLPVVGILVFDNSYNKYCFSLSSDFNLDIALQRCITEIFQSFSMGIDMKLQMNNKLENENYWQREISDEIGFSRTVFNGTGQIPSWLLDVSHIKRESIYPIGYEKLTNEQCKDEILSIVRKIGKRILVRDCSFLGIPTLRIVIPGMSDIYYKNNKIDYPAILTETLMLLGEKNKNAKVNSRLFHNLSLVFESPFWCYECSWKKIYGSYLHVFCGDIEVDIYAYYMALCILHKEYEKAIKFLRKSCAYSSDTKYRQIKFYAGIIIYGLKEKHSEDEIMRVIDVSVDKEKVRQLLYIINHLDDIVGNIEIDSEECVKLSKISKLNKAYKEKMKDLENYKDDLFK